MSALTRTVTVWGVKSSLRTVITWSPTDSVSCDRGGVTPALFPFFGTTLASALASAGCDTCVVTGASTSGCVRATVVDALQHGYRVVVPREAVGDRNPAAHEANLYDIDAKYGDVVSIDEVTAHVEEIAGAHAR